MPQSAKQRITERMEKAIESFKRDLATLRAGRANSALLDRISVEYYGAPTPVNQLANISVPDARTILIQPWDASSLGAIEKSIFSSDLGLNPSNDGSVIRLNLPPLTEERRVDLVKTLKKMSEDAKVAIRNIRRDANDETKKMDLAEDEERRVQDETQKLTDRFTQEVDKIASVKEKEIMEV